MRGRRPLVAALCACVMFACDEPEPQTGIGRDAFVRAYLDLRAATVAGTLDAATRDSILTAHDISEDEMQAFIEGRADDPEALAQIWRDVMDSIAARDAAMNPSADDSL